MVGCEHANLPLPAGTCLSNNTGELHDKVSEYRRLVGILLYLSITRPDLTYSIQQLRQYVQAPTTTHWDAVLHLIMYLKRPITIGLHFPFRSDFKLYAYCDSS